jgi:hypothetical protein
MSVANATKISALDLRRCAMMRLNRSSDEAIAKRLNLTVAEVQDLPLAMPVEWADAYEIAESAFAHDLMSDVMAILNKQLVGSNAREASEAAKAIMRWAIHIDKMQLSKKAQAQPSNDAPKINTSKLVDFICGNKQADNATTTPTPIQKPSAPQVDSFSGKLFSILAYLIVTLSMSGFAKTVRASNDRERVERATVCYATSMDTTVNTQVEKAKTPWKTGQMQALDDWPRTIVATKCVPNVAGT